MITNMIAVLLVSFTTNWTTVSTTYPAAQQGEFVYTVYQPVIDHQVGTVYSNTTMTVEYKGAKVTAVLESVPVSHVNRDIPHNNSDLVALTYSGIVTNKLTLQ